MSIPQTAVSVFPPQLLRAVTVMAAVTAGSPDEHREEQLRGVLKHLFSLLLPLMGEDEKAELEALGITMEADPVSTAVSLAAWLPYWVPENKLPNPESVMEDIPSAAVLGNYM